jgi:hemolysin activation/secretion protein
VRATLFAAAACCALGPSALAQSPLIIDQNRTDRLPTNPNPQGASVPQAQAAPEAATITPFVLKSVRISGASLPPDLLTATLKPFIGRTMDAAGLRSVADAVSAAYGQANIAIFMVSIPQQDFANGELRLVAAEGRIDKINVTGDEPAAGLVRAYGENLLKEKPLTRETLQRYVSLMRDIPGVTPTLNLVPDGAAGTLRLDVDVKQRPYDLSLGVTNNGAPVLGRNQVELDSSVYALLRAGETTKLTVLLPTNINRFQYFSISDAEQLDDEGTVAQLGYGNLHTHPEGGLTGNAETLQLAAVHPFLRSFEESFYGTASIDGIDSRNAVIGETPATERVRTARLGASYGSSDPKTAWSIAGTFSQGLDALGAHEVSPLIAASDFRKLNALASFNHALSEEFVIRLKANVQWAEKRLPVSEFYTLGGPDFGRAFPSATLEGDEGAAVSGEFAWRSQSAWIGTATGSELYVFADDGTVHFHDRGVLPSRDYSLSSAGPGVRVAITDKIAFQVEAAYALSAPRGISDDTWRFNFGVHARY